KAKPKAAAKTPAATAKAAAEPKAAAKPKAKAKTTAKAKPKAKAKAAEPEAEAPAPRGKKPPKDSALVIVESPAKATTIKKYLGSGYVVKASVGHVKDLPKKTMGIDIDTDFQPR